MSQKIMTDKIPFSIAPLIIPPIKFNDKNSVNRPKHSEDFTMRIGSNLKKHELGAGSRKESYMEQVRAKPKGIENSLKR